MQCTNILLRAARLLGMALSLADASGGSSSRSTHAPLAAACAGAHAATGEPGSGLDNSLGALGAAGRCTCGQPQRELPSTWHAHRMEINCPALPKRERQRNPPSWGDDPPQEGIGDHPSSHVLSSSHSWTAWPYMSIYVPCGACSRDVDEEELLRRHVKRC